MYINCYFWVAYQYYLIFLLFNFFIISFAIMLIKNKFCLLLLNSKTYQIIKTLFLQYFRLIICPFHNATNKIINLIYKQK